MTPEHLKELLHYDPETCVFTWRVGRANHVRAGDRAGTTGPDGYVHICVEGKRYRAQQLAWLYVHGVFPTNVDHKNGNQQQNEIANLRAASVRQNQGNARRRADNTTGFKGVTFYRRNGKYRAQIRLASEKKHLGYYDTPEQAHAAYANAAGECFGEFARLS